MSNSNARLANHLAAPKTAAFVGNMRQAFGKVEVTYVCENTVLLGNKTDVIERELVTYSREEKIKGKTVYSRVAFVACRIIEKIKEIVGRVAE